MLFSKGNATLRQQEKIYGFVRLVIVSFEHESYMFSHLLFLLVYIKIMKSELYAKLENSSLSLQELSDEFYDLLYDNLHNSYNINLLYTEAMLLIFYNNQKDYQKKDNLIEKDEQGESFTRIKSKLETEGERDSLVGYLEHISVSFRHSDVGLSYLFKKINLIEPLNIN